MGKQGEGAGAARAPLPTTGGRAMPTRRPSMPGRGAMPKRRGAAERPLLARWKRWRRTTEERRRRRRCHSRGRPNRRHVKPQVIHLRAEGRRGRPLEPRRRGARRRVVPEVVARGDGDPRLGRARLTHRRLRRRGGVGSRGCGGAGGRGCGETAAGDAAASLRLVSSSSTRMTMVAATSPGATGDRASISFTRARGGPRVGGMARGRREGCGSGGDQGGGGRGREILLRQGLPAAQSPKLGWVASAHELGVFYGSELRSLVQTVQTAIKTTRSKSNGSRERWVHFTKNYPPALLILQNTPSGPS
jgi:hypothetical protein